MDTCYLCHQEDDVLFQLQGSKVILCGECLDSSKENFTVKCLRCGAVGTLDKTHENRRKMERQGVSWNPMAEVVIFHIHGCLNCQASGYC